MKKNWKWKEQTVESRDEMRKNQNRNWKRRMNMNREVRGE